MALQVGCGSSGGADGRDGRDAELDARGMDASDAGDVSANPDVAPDAPEDTPVDTPDDARDVSTEADAATGCGITDGVWTVIPLMAWSYEYKRMWSTGPATFLFYGENGDLRRWNGSGSTALA